MSHYVVTGAAGFIGSRVTGLLLDEGHTVTGVDSLNNAYDVRLKHWRLDQLRKQPDFTFHHLDICDREALDATVFEGSAFDAIINLAARAGVRQSVEDPWIYHEANVIGTLNLLEQCRQREIPKFVLASTSSLYGSGNPLPYHEDLNTDHPLSPYAASKKGAEALCYTYHYLYGIDVTVFRYFTVYGPAGRPDMSLFRFVQWISEDKPVRIFGDGSQSRDFTYVDDVARGTIAGLRPLGFEVINLGSDTPIVLMDTIRRIEAATGCKADIIFQPRHPSDVTATWADVSKAQRLLGWAPQVDFKEGLAALVSWYDTNRDWARAIQTG